MPDIEEFLQPISEAAPAGEDVRYDIVYDQVRDARESDPLADPPVVPDFREVRKLAEDVLRKRSKHLQIAAWLAEGWTHLEGAPGLVAGLVLQRRLVEEFWDSVFPEIDDDGDLSFRAAPVRWVADYLGPSLQAVPLTVSGLTIIEFQQGRAVGYEEDLGGDYEKTQARNAEIESGKLPPEDFDTAVDETPKAFYKALLADLARAVEAVDALDATTEEKFQDLDPDDYPGFRSLKDDIAALQRVARPILEKKLELDPDPIVATEPDDAGGEVVSDVGGDGGGVPIEPVSRKDAGVRVAAVARFLRGSDPHDPAPYLMIRGLRWGELRRGGASVDPRLLDAPPTATRTRLKSMLLDGKWEALLESAEDVMASTFGRGWLDLQRYVFTALDGLGSEYDQVEASLKGALRSLLIDLPSLPDLTLMDDTPTANRETRQWLQDEGLLGPLTEEEQARMQTDAAPMASIRDVSDRARERVRAGQPQKAIELLMQAADQERSERGRSLRRAEAAGVMVDHGLAPVAMPILRDVMARIEEFRLEEWESPETVAVPMALLYRCIDRMGGDESEKQELYLRVCRLDPMQAILFTSDDSASTEESAGEFEES